MATFDSQVINFVAVAAVDFQRAFAFSTETLGVRLEETQSADCATSQRMHVTGKINRWGFWPGQAALLEILRQPARSIAPLDER